MQSGLNRACSVFFTGILLFTAALAWAEGDRPATGPATGPATTQAAVVQAEFIFDAAPFRSCHASTIAETKAGLAAAWFGGSREGADDVGIWVSRRERDGWSAPVQVATGQSGDNDRRYPCWNPVLYQPGDGPLLLFYKVGPSPSKWWGMMMTSADAGRTWSDPRRLPDGMLGPIKNKPVALADGTLLCPSSTEDDGWRVHLERTPDLGKSWTKSEPLNAPKPLALIQPTVLDRGRGRIQLLCRSRQGNVVELRSADNGKTWSEPKAIDLPNPNSGIDAVQLKDGRSLLVYNHTPIGRSPLNVALSLDGSEWSNVLALERAVGEYSYPAVIQTADGLVHITYTWKRQRIRHVVIDPRRLGTGTGRKPAG